MNLYIQSGNSVQRLSTRLW